MENTFFLKERDMFTKILLRTVFLVLMILLTSSAMYAKEAASEPIIEGKGVAGLKIGDTEESVISVISRGLFKLYKVERGLDLNDKFISFGNAGEDGVLVIDVLLSKGKIGAILLISESVKGNHLYKGKTTEGFSFGDTFQKVEQLYGKPVIEKGIYMYKKEGIAFGTVGPIEGKEPNSIIIMSPGSDFNIDAIFQ